MSGQPRVTLLRRLGAAERPADASAVTLGSSRVRVKVTVRRFSGRARRLAAHGI